MIPEKSICQLPESPSFHSNRYYMRCNNNQRFTENYNLNPLPPEFFFRDIA